LKKKIIKISINFLRVFKVLEQPNINAAAASVDSGHFPIAAVGPPPPIVNEVVLDVVGWLIMQLFYHLNTD
jgi:hypothetical protein